MKKNIKKIIFIFLILLIIISVILFFIKRNKKNEEYQEYEPEEEISQEQERQTMISLYFVNKTTRKVEPEVRLVDVKELMKEPYKVIVNMLIEGPKNNNHEKTIADGTTLIGASIEGDTLKLNFSKEFVDNHPGGKNEENNTIESIVNSVTELTEVNSVRILINGQEKQKFKDGEVDFSQDFIRND